MKPLIFYVDDEPYNLTVFEAALPSEWEIRTFSNPLQALEALQSAKPWVLVSDQRMPGITGVKYFELAKAIHPNAIRIIVTGYSEEDLVVESVRKAQIFDYIKKPWEPDELEASLIRAIEHYKVNEHAKALHEKLVEQNESLKKVSAELEQTIKGESEIRKELECWVPPFVLRAVREHTTFPVSQDLVGLTFDIVQSSKLHHVRVNGRALRKEVIKLFSEAVLRHGGWRESHSGDSAFAHFGLGGNPPNPAEAALASAREFRVSLRSLKGIHDVDVECGIALHLARGAQVEVHTIQVQAAQGMQTQKSFDTSSIDIDCLHRMEKLVHVLQGSNIIMSKEFASDLKSPPNMVSLGPKMLKGQERPIELFLIPSDRASPQELDALKEEILPKAA